jgi:RNA polymerase sigma-70 factor (TIGR02960 family)
VGLPRGTVPGPARDLGYSLAVTGGRHAEPEHVLLARARAGDEGAFGVLIAPYLRELHVHCYRMLGSVHDAEDVLQEVLVRAWRHLGTFDGRGPVRGWLYRIATNRCLTARSRAAAPPAPVLSPVPPPPNAPDVEVTALHPYPDDWLGELVGPDDPAAGYELRESVQLAFLTVVQLLPARQRAVLLLRDVLGFSAAETAQILQASQAAVTSSLQRARATLQAHRDSGRIRPVGSPGAGADRALADRFTAAWHASDVPALVSVLAEDCLLTMPPAPLAYRGRDLIGSFFATVPAGGDLAAIRLVPTRANGQPAVAAYQRDGETARAYGIMVLTVRSGLIGEITGFADPSLFPLFGLPLEAGWPPGQADLALGGLRGL